MLLFYFNGFRNCASQNSHRISITTNYCIVFLVSKSMWKYRKTDECPSSVCLFFFRLWFAYTIEETRLAIRLLFCLDRLLRHVVDLIINFLMFIKQIHLKIFCFSQTIRNRSICRKLSDSEISHGSKKKDLNSLFRGLLSLLTKINLLTIEYYFRNSMYFRYSDDVYMNLYVLVIAYCKMRKRNKALLLVICFTLKIKIKDAWSNI